MKLGNITFKADDKVSEIIAHKAESMQWEELTREERAHLTDFDIRTLDAFKKVAANQKQWRDHPQGNPDQCYECKAIAKKLNLPV